MSLVSVNAEKLATVVRLACLTEDRTNQEQGDLLHVAARCDRARNADTVTNRPRPSALEREADATRVLEDGERRIKPSWERKR